MVGSFAGVLAVFSEEDEAFRKSNKSQGHCQNCVKQIQCSADLSMLLMRRPRPRQLSALNTSKFGLGRSQ